MEITPFVWFSIIGVSALIVSIPAYFANRSDKYFDDSLECMRILALRLSVEPFIVSEYCDGIEKASLEILDEKKPTDRIIILWWGLDGLRMDEDGNLEWISRKKPEQVKQEASPNAMCQVINPVRTGMENVRPTFRMDGMQQATQAQIDELQSKNRVMQMQAVQSAWNTAMTATLQSHVIPTPYSYPSYLYGGTGGVGHCGTGIAVYSPYLQQIQRCCCDSVKERPGG